MPGRGGAVTAAGQFPVHRAVALIQEQRVGPAERAGAEEAP